MCFEIRVGWESLIPTEIKINKYRAKTVVQQQLFDVPNCEVESNDGFLNSCTYVALGGFVWWWARTFREDNESWVVWMRWKRSLRCERSVDVTSPRINGRRASKTDGLDYAFRGFSVVCTASIVFERNRLGYNSLAI